MDAVTGPPQSFGIKSYLHNFYHSPTVEDIEHDPHYIARNAIVRLPDPDYGTLPAPCIVPRIIGREMRTPRTGPAVGEHNAEVYGEFGLDAADLATLRSQQII